MSTERPPGEPGAWMYGLIVELYPICRSITGEGLRETLRRLQQWIPLTLHEVPSGTRVFDWTVPKEWNIRDAYVKNARGERVIDFQRHNLHVVNYSIPVRQTMRLADLRPHLFTIPNHPEWIPYRTTYYEEAWGFCLAHVDYLALEDGDYEVCIDSTLADGHLSYGELCVPGQQTDEILISCHSCHPSLCNDNLSGMALAVALAREVGRKQRKHTYRFLFIPGTIGSITWLARNEEAASRVQHGLVLSCVGDAGRSTYKRSRRGDDLVDRAAAHVFQHSGQDHELLDFVPYGYDERQYCSPGFDLAVGCFMRTPNGCYPEYHSSADDLSLVRPDALTDSYEKCLRILDILDGDEVWLSQNPRCEPQLGRRGLYRGVASGAHQLPGYELALLWVLNLSDGRHSLMDIAERASMGFEVIGQAASALESVGLLRRAPASPREAAVGNPPLMPQFAQPSGPVGVPPQAAKSTGEPELRVKP